jgi:hypothetical protein
MEAGSVSSAKREAIRLLDKLLTSRYCTVHSVDLGALFVSTISKVVLSAAIFQLIKSVFRRRYIRVNNQYAELTIIGFNL